MCFIVFTMIFILTFPTLASSMTGYSVTNVAFVQSSDNNLIRFSDFQAVAYVIHDGPRINLTPDFMVTYDMTTDYSMQGTTGI